MGDLVEKYLGVPTTRRMARGNFLKMPTYSQKLEKLEGVSFGVLEGKEKRHFGRGTFQEEGIMNTEPGIKFH